MSRRSRIALALVAAFAAVTFISAGFLVAALDGPVLGYIAVVAVLLVGSTAAVVLLAVRAKESPEDRGDDRFLDRDRWAS